MGGQLIDPGLIVTLPDDFVPGWYLTPLDDAAQVAYDKYESALPNSMKPKPEGSTLEIQIDDPGLDTGSNEVDLSQTLASANLTQAQPGPTEAKPK
jgi:hypothetical protein